jgi:drug/metabolite transporter (DMT)-like permease
MTATSTTSPSARADSGPVRPSDGLARDAEGRLLIDTRGPRVAAAVTVTVLGTALVVGGPLGTVLLVWQWLVFGVAAVLGLRWSVYGNLFRAVKRRLDLGPPPAVEPEAGPRFAQACGFAVLSVAVAATVLGAPGVATGATVTVLALAALLAGFDVCIGCRLYGLLVRLPGPLGLRR